MATKKLYKGWNYRVIRKQESGSKEVYFNIHEVYYNQKEIGVAWSKDAMYPQGVTVRELMEDISLMASAYHKPILEIKKKGKKEVLVEYFKNKKQ